MNHKVRKGRDIKNSINCKRFLPLQFLFFQLYSPPYQRLEIWHASMLLVKTSVGKLSLRVSLFLVKGERNWIRVFNLLEYENRKIRGSPTSFPFNYLFNARKLKPISDHFPQTWLWTTILHYLALFGILMDLIYRPFSSEEIERAHYCCMNAHHPYSHANTRLLAPR